MERDPTPWLSYRMMADMVLWAVLLGIVLLYLWATLVGPVSAVDPALQTAPMPFQKPISPPGNGPALV